MQSCFDKTFTKMSQVQHSLIWRCLLMRSLCTSKRCTKWNPVLLQLRRLLRAIVTGQVHFSLLASSPFMASEACRERTCEWVALASPFACCSRVPSRDFPKWRACSQARLVSGGVTRSHNEKTAQTTEAFYLEGLDLLLTRNLHEDVQKNSLKQIS